MTAPLRPAGRGLARVLAGLALAGAALGAGAQAPVAPVVAASMPEAASAPAAASAALPASPEAASSPAAASPSPPASVSASVSASASASASGLPADCPPPAAPPTPEQVQRVIAQAADRGALWRVTRNGRESWLYGTIHVGRLEWLSPGPRVLDALRRADRVAFELDFSNPDIVARLLKGAAASERAKPLAPRLQARLERDARQACVDPAMVAGLRPEIAAVEVSLGVVRRQGLDGAYGVDPMLAALARRLGKDIRSLETPEAQMALLVSDDPRRTARMVSDTLDEVESGSTERQMTRLVEDWRTGRVDDLARYADWCGCVRTAAQRRQMRQLLDERNPAMARQLAAWHREGRSVFVAVGLLHMVGPRGLPALLAAQGFRVERLPFDTH